MWRVLIFLLIVASLALGLARFADEPGSLVIDWLGYRIETSVFATVLGLIAVFAGVAIVIWLLRFLITRPAAIARFMRGRREKRGLEALSRGLLAVGAGDQAQAQRYASLARRSLPHEPLTAMLRAQAAQLTGDRAQARRIYEAMVESPDTEIYGLHGLYLEASREDETEAARQFAERAMRKDPRLAWSVNGLFELQCRAGDWAGALETLDVARRNSQIDRPTANRRRAVLLTAQAMAAEDSDPNRARELALEAHKLAPDLVPAADIAGRLLAANGQTSRAARVLSRTWRFAPHPELAQAYAFLRAGDAPRDRLKRVRSLAQSTPDSIEGPIALANAAIDAREWEAARETLAPYLEDQPPARVCLLMARIEAGEHGDEGRVREWLARALRAPRDPAWTADGVVSERWAPISPVTGALDAFEWKVPVAILGPAEPLEAVEALSRREPALAFAPAPSAAETMAEPTEETTGEAGEEEPTPEAEPAETVETSAAEVESAVKAPPPEPPPPREPAPPPKPAAAPEPEPARPAETKPRLRVPAGSAPSTLAREPRIFVAPRAPDDPGPVGSEIEDDADIAGFATQRRT